VRLRGKVEGKPLRRIGSSTGGASGATRKSFMTGPGGDLGDLVQRGYRFALSLTHDANRAEDLIQDAWFSILRARGPWRREYLFTTIRNRFIDLCRRDRIVVFEPLDEDRAGEGSDRHGADATEDDSAFLVNGAFDRALGELRVEERAVLYLSAVEGYTANQTAELLGWPRGSVLSLMHRARLKLRRLVDQTPESTP